MNTFYNLRECLSQKAGRFLLPGVEEFHSIIPPRAELVITEQPVGAFQGLPFLTRIGLVAPLARLDALPIPKGATIITLHDNSSQFDLSAHVSHSSFSFVHAEHGNN